MASFEIAGKSTQTNRKRKVVVSAQSEVEAQIKADRLGLVETTISRLPEAPATERQISYAQALGIEIPQEATLEQLSNLISMKVDNDRPSSEHHREIARNFGIEVTDYIGKKALFNRVMSELSAPERERELIAWFAYRITRSLFEGRKDSPIGGPDHPIIADIANNLCTNPTVIKSIRKYSGESLVWFGDFTASDGQTYNGGSVGTIGYKEVSRLLTEKLGLASKAKSNSESRTIPTPRVKKHSDQRKGCLSVLIIGTFTALSLAYMLGLAVGNT